MPVGHELFGRDRESAIIREHLVNRRHLLIYGGPGTGKSALLRQAYQEGLGRDGLRRLLCGQGWSLAAVVRQCAEQIFTRTGGGSEAVGPPQPLPALKAAVVQAMTARPCTLFLDDVIGIPPKYLAFLDQIFDCATLLVTAPSPQAAGRLWYLSFGFDQMELRNLDAPTAHCLALHLVEHYGAPSEGRETLARGIARVTWGNPGLIHRLCRLAASGRYGTGARAQFRLMLLDARMEAAGLVVNGRRPQRG